MDAEALVTPGCCNTAWFVVFTSALMTSAGHGVEVPETAYWKLAVVVTVAVQVLP